MYLEITSVETLTDSTGVDFKKVGFAPLTFLPNGKQVLATGRERFRTIFPDCERIVDGKPTMIKGDMLFKTAAKGEIVEGQIATFDTTEDYSIEGRKFNRITVVAFKGESPAVLAANNAGVAVVNEDGERIEPTKKRIAPKSLI